MNADVNEALFEPAFKDKLEAIGGMVMSGTPGDFRKVMVSETQKWGDVIKRAGIKLD
jgi:tripartite-type tricarboxylate transporter receptor subunit TctC